ncbi:hypothetical protein NG800_009495 [Epilithonimonas ginsengisoli]|uniref:Uncharacterized protein n=1 Tax=Epilithonimonas ginsengisoli TaxID=1245592 RepID=A0ABU4JHI6_9FLAO|nr:hypothetical protein [Epilithonimonas ginsengisoli]MDW8549146.1 hypothetical protein [Epilithonimonas ginsengisoli]
MSIGFLFKNTQDENIEMDSDKIKKISNNENEILFLNFGRNGFKIESR